MLKVIYISIVCLILCSCTGNDPNKAIVAKPDTLHVNDSIKYSPVNTVTKIDSLKIIDSCYFEFDEVYHYQVAISRDELSGKDSTRSRSLKDHLLINLLEQEAPEKPDDKHFIDYLKKSIYKKKKLEGVSKEDLKKIFKFREVSNYSVSECMPVYRDILVFRLNGLNTGVAKICFECEQHSFSGAKYPAYPFGQRGEFKKLKKILY